MNAIARIVTTTLLTALSAVALAPNATAAAKFEPTLVAHRGGGGGTADEANPAALYKTFKTGVKYIELDVWINAEGNEFILHDQTLDRTTDCTGIAVTKPIVELQACGVMSLGTALYLVHKYSFTVYLHQKGTRSDKQAKEIAREVSSRHMNDSHVRFIADGAATLKTMDKYVDHRWLGLIVNHQSEWADKTWPELWYYAGPITKVDVQTARKRGQKVSIIQNADAVASLEQATVNYAPFEKWMYNEPGTTTPPEVEVGGSV